MGALGLMAVLATGSGQTLGATPVGAATALGAEVGAEVGAQVGAQVGATREPRQDADRNASPAASDLAAMEAHLDSLVDRLATLEPRADAEREAQQAAMEAGWDAPLEREVGGIRIRALPRDMDAAVELFTSVWAEVFEPALGPPPPPASRMRVGYYDHRGEWNPRIGEGQQPGQYVQVRNALDDRRTQAVHALATAFVRRAPFEVHAWFDFTTERGFDPRTDWLTIRRQLAAAGSPAVRGCLGGDLEACTVSVGLRPEGWDAARVVSAWYTTEQLRTRFLRGWPRSPDAAPRRAVATELLLSHRDEEFVVPSGYSPTGEPYALPAGTRILHSGGPTSPAARSAVLSLALEMGGPDAPARLLALPFDTPLEEALARTAQRSVPEVMAEWRRRLDTEAVPEGPALPSRSTVAWIGLLALFSMTSTRWRLGR